MSLGRRRAAAPHHQQSRTTRRALPAWPFLLSLALLAFAAACSSAPAAQPRVAVEASQPSEIRKLAVASILITDKPESAGPALDAVKILPRIVLLDAGETVQLDGAAYGVDGRRMHGVETVWSTVDPRAGSISSEGEFRAGSKPGEFKNAVSATAIHNTPEGTKTSTGYASVTVVGELEVPRLASVAIIPANPTVLRQQIHRLRAVGFDEDGLVIPDVSFVWELRESAVGRLNDIGYLPVKGDTGTYDGAVSVTGIWQGARISASTDVRIVSTPQEHDFVQVHALPQQFHLDPSDRLQLRAVALNGLGELISGTQLRWTMVDDKAGTIDGTGNFIAGSAPGIYTEAVRVEAIVPGERGFVKAEDFASVVVRRKQTTNRLSRIVVEPGTIRLPRRGRAAPLARAIDESGYAAQNTTLSWTVVKEGVGEISAEGAFTTGDLPGMHSGALEVTAVQRLGGETVTRTRLVDVVVTGNLIGAAINPSIAVVEPGRTIHFSLTGRDENGVELPGLVVLWSVSDDRVGTIDPFGNFTAAHIPGVYQDVVQAEVVQALPDLP